METFRQAVRALVAAAPPMTVRHAFYLAGVAHLVEKTEAGYDAVERALLWMRRNNRMPWEWITDGARQRFKPKTYSSVEQALEETARLYRRALWRDQGVHVEIWCEKDTLTGLLWPITNEWDISLMVSRGFTSDTYLHEAAEDLVRIGKPAHLYYVGDYDPSGVLIDQGPRGIEQKLRGFAPGVTIHFERLAVTEGQIADWSLPTRPTKRVSRSGAPNSHAKNFASDQSVEVEAIPPGTLRQLVRAAIERHVDRRQLEITRVAERSEREVMARLSATFRHSDDDEDDDA